MPNVNELKKIYFDYANQEGKFEHIFEKWDLTYYTEFWTNILVSEGVYETYTPAVDLHKTSSGSDLKYAICIID